MGSHNFKDLEGHRFGPLLVLGRAGKRDTGHVLWRCRHDDGTEVVRIGSYLTRLAGGNASEHDTWASMIARCQRPTAMGYGEYGGRGIRVCERWLSSFEDFLTDMGTRPTPKHSLDRIDVNGNYEPTNCRWATLQEQARNKRNTKWVAFQGETLSVAGWADKLGMSQHNIQNRLRQGLPLEEVFDPKLKSKGRNGPRGQRVRPRLGMSDMPEYRAWEAMVQRCTNQNHPAWVYYGGRGISVCSQWLDFRAFYEDMGLHPGPGFSLDRTDNERGYEPTNCRWATRKEQGRNTRKARLLSHGGRTQNLSAWAEELQLPVETIRSRLRSGWSESRALGFG